MVPVHVALGPSSTSVQSVLLPPVQAAQVPTLCGSQAAWLAGAVILLQAVFVFSGSHAPGTNAFLLSPVRVPVSSSPSAPKKYQKQKKTKNKKQIKKRCQ